MKNQFQDIIPSDKRSIRNIPLPEKKKSSANGRVLNIRHKTKLPSEEVVLESEKEELEKLAPSRRRAMLEDIESNTFNSVPNTRGRTRFFLWIITIAIVFALFFAITSIFKSATIYITEKSSSFALSGQQTFYVNPKVGQQGYSVIIVSDSVTAEVQATGEKQVKSPASGTIAIFNNYSTASQRLIAGTRFETPAGLIYKLNEAVVVPGMTKEKNKNVASSVEAIVTAEKPGSDYNIPLSDFTIPAFKGDPKYKGFYARSKTPMTGGSSGMVATVDDATLASTVADLKKKLEASLKDKAIKQLPATQQTFDGFSKITYTVSDPKSLGGDLKGKALVKVDASARVYALDINSYARKLLGADSATSSTESQFSIDFSQVKSSLGTEASSTLTAALDGQATVIWNLDKQNFLSAIAGKPVSDVPRIAATFPAIEKHSVVIKPFSLWDTSLPKSTDKMSIVIQR